MAFRTWGRLLLTALGVSVLAGAGQLGIAYGFGIVRLGGTFTDGTVNRWPAQLVWVGWFAAVAAVAGAVLTERLARREGFPGGTTEQLSVAGAAALGATVVAPLCMQPARAAELNTVDPVWAVGICAVLGAVVGAGAALAVLLRPPLGWNIAMTAGVVWLLALVSVAPSLASTGPLPTVRLGVLEPAWLDPAAAQRLATLIMPTAALLAGAAVGALARRSGQPPLVGGAAGAAGPVLVAFAYLTAGPGDPADRYQLAPYYGALIAVAAGALGSTAATVLRRPTPAGDPATAAIAPSEILQPLPADAPPLAHPAVGGSAPDATGAAAGTVGLLAAGRDGSPGDATSPTPAHWDWPVTAGSTPAPVPADRPRPTPVNEENVAVPAGSGPTDEQREPLPSTAIGPVAERDADDALRSRPTPGGLPSGRRTSAIDVLAGPPARTPDTGATAPPRTPLAPTAPTPATPLPATVPAPASFLAPVPPPQPATPSAQPTESAPATPSAQPAESPAPAAQSVTTGEPVPPASPVDASTAREDTAAPASISDDPPADPSPTGAAPDLTQTAPEQPTPAGRAKRTRKPRTAAATAGTGSAPAGTDPAAPAPTGPVDVTGAPAPRSPRRATARRTPAEAATPDPSPGGTVPTAAPDAPVDSDPTTGGSGDTPTVGAPAGPSPRPRFPIFEDATDRPGDVRPAWPIPPTPAWPVAPRAAGGSPDPATDGTGGRTPGDATLRPRHRALPDLERAASWDAFASARRAGVTPDKGSTTADVPAGPAASPPDDGTRRTDDRPANADGPTTRAATGATAGTATDTTRATVGGDEPGGGKSRLRRGLFRRNRAKGNEEIDSDRTNREPEAVPAHDEEYVDWVTGLARPTQDTESAEARTLRTGRHHRD